jgi:hypothetical protein
VVGSTGGHGWNNPRLSATALAESYVAVEMKQQEQMQAHQADITTAKAVEITLPSGITRLPACQNWPSNQLRYTGAVARIVGVVKKVTKKSGTWPGFLALFYSLFPN